MSAFKSKKMEITIKEPEKACVRPGQLVPLKGMPAHCESLKTSRESK